MIMYGFSLNDLGGLVVIYVGILLVILLGINGIFVFLVMLLINLGIVNLILILVLDGGKFFLNIVEGIICWLIFEKVEGILNLVGFVFLMILMVFVIYNDI